MPDIDFLALDDVLEIHRDQIERYGGSSEIRDIGLLQSAVVMPAAAFGGQYVHRDIFTMAAAYLFHITQNHPFVTINDIEIDASENELEDVVWRVAIGQADKQIVASFLKQHSTS